MKRPLAYITAPWGDNEFENTENAAKYKVIIKNVQKVWNKNVQML